MTTHVYLITEGPQDVAFFARLLDKGFGFSLAATERQIDALYREWLRGISWPIKGRIDLPYVEAPEIHVRPPEGPQSNGIEVAMVSAGGIHQIEDRLKKHLDFFGRQAKPLDAIGVVLDADDEGAPADRRQEMSTALESALRVLDLPVRPHTEILVLPGGASSGTLEDVLLPLGQRVYGPLLELAEPYIDAAWPRLADLPRDERRAAQKPAGRKKALLSAVSAVLKPGKAIQNTIKDHRWISPDTLTEPALAPALEFLRRLIQPASA